jgi:hypothetical protein
MTLSTITLDELRRRAIQATASHDWHWHGKGDKAKLVLLRGGWEKMAAIFGVTLAIRHCEPKDYLDAGGNRVRYVYTAGVTARFHSPLVATEVCVDEEGASASDDAFVATRYEWNDQTNSSEAKTLDADDVNEGNVMKKAITNAYGRAVTTLLGLGDVTEDELTQASVTPPQKGEGKAGSKTQQTAKITQAEADSIKQEISQILKVLASKQAREKYPEAVDEAMPSLAKEEYMILCKTVTQWTKADGTVGRPGVESLTKLVNHVSPHVLNAAKALYLKESGHAWAGGAA